jgi:hypothetical protein
MADQDFLTTMAQTNPELLRRWMELGVLGDQGSQFEQQMQTSQALRAGGIPRGRMIGDVYAPAGLAEVGLSVFNNVRGALSENQAKQGLEGIRAKQLAGRTSYAEELAKYLRQRQEPARALVDPYGALEGT